MVIFGLQSVTKRVATSTRWLPVRHDTPSDLRHVKSAWLTMATYFERKGLPADDPTREAMDKIHESLIHDEMQWPTISEKRA